MLLIDDGEEEDFPAEHITD